MLALAVALLVAAPPASPLPGTTVTRSCGGSGQPYPQYAASSAGGATWIACRERGQILRANAAGKITARIAAPNVVSIAAGPEGVWAVAREQGRLFHVVGGRARPAATYGDETPYVFVAGGSVWVVVGAAGLVRVDPAHPSRSTQVSVGDGPSDVVSDGRSAWVICHRDHTLWRVGLASGRVTQLTTLPGDTPERLALVGGKLWITGRGTDLFRVDATAGAVESTIEIGVGGIDLVATTRGLWVAAAGAADDRLGLPVVTSLHRVDPASGKIVETIHPKRRTFANGLAASGGRVWIQDSVAGLLIRR
jgi:hypothetical protein